MTVTDHATLTVTTYPQVLLTTAAKLIDDGQPNVAIITSHLACEIAADRAFDAAYAERNLEALGEAIDGIMNGHNLGNEKHRRLYNALTGSNIETEPFWTEFKKASEKRNGIVHKNQHATKADAEAALAAAKALVTYLKQIGSRV